MIELYKPGVEELWFKQKMLADEQTMSFNKAYGGTIHFPRERWEAWYDRWIVNHEQKRFYRYIRKNDNFVGEAAYHFDEYKQMYLVDILVYAPYRNQGYGHEALTEICKIAKENQIQELFDEIAIDNSAINMFLKCGFVEVIRNEKYILIKRKF
jgi:RimJ/RimL family protein N-acetyltransferase